DLLFEAHSSVLDVLFRSAEQFPAEWRGSAFVALKGSWNRSEPTGYKVVRVPFKDGRPEGGYENFVVGFWTSGTQRAEVWGRPTALAVTKDGALLIADDTGGTIWRISYNGPKQQTGAPSGTTGGRGGQRGPPLPVLRCGVSKSDPGGTVARIERDAGSVGSPSRIALRSIRATLPT